MGNLDMPGPTGYSASQRRSADADGWSDSTPPLKRRAAGLECAGMQKQSDDTSKKMLSFLRWQESNESLLKRILPPKVNGGIAFDPNPDLPSDSVSTVSLALAKAGSKHHAIYQAATTCFSWSGARLTKTPAWASAANISQCGIRFPSSGCM